MKRLYIIENVWYDIVSFVCISRTSHKTFIILSHLFVCILPCSLIRLTVAIDISWHPDLSWWFHEIPFIHVYLMLLIDKLTNPLYNWYNVHRDIKQIIDCVKKWDVGLFVIFFYNEKALYYRKRVVWHREFRVHITYKSQNIHYLKPFVRLYTTVFLN